MVGYASLKLRMLVWAGDIHSVILCVKTIFETMGLGEISKGIQIQKRRRPRTMVEVIQYLIHFPLAPRILHCSTCGYADPKDTPPQHLQVC